MKNNNNQILIKTSVIMKKKLFSLFAIFFVAVLCVGFASCGDDDDDDNVAVGTWVAQEGRFSYSLNFRSNGSGTVITKYEDSYSGTETVSEKFSYSITKNNNGIITFDDGDSYSGSSKQVYYFEIKGKKMFLYYDKSSSEYILELTKQK